MGAEIAFVACEEVGGMSGHSPAEDRPVLFPYFDLQRTVGREGDLAFLDEEGETGQGRGELRFQISSRFFDGIRIGQAGGVV
jgi:hypothetical protein